MKEITPELVKYTNPGEDVLNSVYKNVVQKIVFKSGRVEVFAEAAAYKKVNVWREFEKVLLTQAEKDINGLIRIGDISTIEQGGSMFSNLAKIEDRAQRNLKIVAAMMGGNIIYIRHQDVQGSRYGTPIYGTAIAVNKPMEAFIAGIVYTNEPANADAFRKVIGDKKEFQATESASFTGNANDVRVYPSKRKFTVKEVKIDNDLLIVDGALEGASKYKSFKVASFDKEYFHVYYEDKGTAYNIKIKI
ncbi:hypothetical protein WG947_13800 [Pontibacter sp. H259]|uniref:hypothetical protein n=1 Tax=Pontibacter sp. H259 TaxID=3133421 RepID=UPI0030C429D5